MMVSLRHRLVVLAMPKCASTALETALAEHMDIVIKGMPSAKHTPFRKYRRHLKDYLESFSDSPMETVCLFREPIDWLNSWWRYRGRTKLRDPNRSTRNMTFDVFVNRYMDGNGPPADIGRQSRFISDAKGTPSVDHLFRYDNLDGLSEFISARMGVKFELGQENVSPPAHQDASLQDTTKERLREALALDFQIYSGLLERKKPLRWSR